MRRILPTRKKSIKAGVDLREGRAVIQLAPEIAFNNPDQEFKRDLSVVALTLFVEDFQRQKNLEADKRRQRLGLDAENRRQYEPVDITLLDVKTAIGIRTIRYAKEVMGITKIVANDISLEAAETVDVNVKFNNVDHIVKISNRDPGLVMLLHRRKSKRFAALDVDPSYSPTIYLDAAVQCVTDGGFLMVTATDVPVLAGIEPGCCHGRYGALSVKTKSCHEMALRILLKRIMTCAGMVGRYIEPMLSVLTGTYVRVFVKMRSGAAGLKKTICKLSWMYHCAGCDSITLQPVCELKSNPNAPEKMKMDSGSPPPGRLCEHCNEGLQMGGPIWAAPLHDPSFVARALERVDVLGLELGTVHRLRKTLRGILQELTDPPLYRTMDQLCRTVHSTMIPMKLFRSALLNAGYQVSSSHMHKLAIKTDAPNTFIWDIMRAWTTLHPVKAAKLEADIVARNILSKPISQKVVFNERADAVPEGRRRGRKRKHEDPIAKSDDLF